MTKIKTLLTTSIITLVQCGVILAQRRPPQPGAGETCAGCGVCGGTLMVPIILFVAWFALSIYLLVWVARDAKARGLDNSVLWMILVLFTGLIGFTIYYFSRPQGELVQCQHCGNKRLAMSARCPTCGNA